MPEQATTSVTVTRVERGTRTEADDVLSVEEPLEIRLGISDGETRLYRSISITMRTPGHDRELAAGFLFTEAIVTSPEDISLLESWGPRSNDAGTRNVTRVDLAPGVRVDLRRLERH